MAGKPAANVGALVAAGMALLVIGVTTREQLAAGTFGLSGDVLTGVVMGLSLGFLVLAVVAGLGARRG
ncbi:hypothetical protein [Phenylobacterium sp.]|uniref:hypothetical protein n=1 Tax=Phenylobacterium sp. TaxID=1871053 RepID=UPI002B8A2A6A|nr:hypothetical protein [Phenylobacterium sp.]HVI31754.1 hypothetical protein [Phenylobacterium sp.]